MLFSQGVPDTTQTFACLDPEHVCTSRGPICVSIVDNPQITPACGDTSQCGVCGADDNGKYTCTSRTTFTMCFDGQLTDIRVTCPDNQICDIAKAKAGENPCVPSCQEPTIEICDLSYPIDEPVVTTTEATITTTTMSVTTTTKVPTTEVPTTEVPTTPPPITTTTTAELPLTTTEEMPIITTTTENITTTTEEVTTTTIISPIPTRPITTTTEEPTTIPPTTTTENPANIVCSQQTAVGRYPYPNDTTCKK